MRNELIGLYASIVLACTTATSGCNTTTDPVGTGGSSTGAAAGDAGGSPGSEGAGGRTTEAGMGGAAPSIGGSSASAGASGSVTSVAATKILGSLTSDERSQLCSDAFAYYGRTISKATMCKAQGLTLGISSSAPTDEVLQETCKTKENSCLQADLQAPFCDAFPSPCTATVALYSACISDYAAWYNQSVSELVGCAEYTRSGLPAVWDFVTADPRPSCAALNDSCAGVNYPTPR